MIEANWTPNQESLARFGRVAPLGLGLLGLLTAWNTGVFSGESSWIFPGIIWASGVIMFGLSWVAPKILLPAYWVLFGLGWLIFTVLGYLMMVGIFLLVMTPIAIIFRLMGRNVLQPKPDPNAKSYWLPKKESKSKTSYFRQS